MLIWLLFWLAFPGSSSKLSCHNMTSSLSKMMSSSSNMTQLQILEFMPTSNSRRPWDSSERVKGQVLCKGSQVCEMGLCSRWLPTYFLIYPLSITATQQGNKMFSRPQLFYRNLDRPICIPRTHVLKWLKQWQEEPRSHFLTVWCLGWYKFG